MLLRLGALLWLVLTAQTNPPAKNPPRPATSPPPTPAPFALVEAPACASRPCVKLLFTGTSEILIHDRENPPWLKVVLPNFKKEDLYERRKTQGHVPYIYIHGSGRNPDKKKCVEWMEADSQKGWRCRLLGDIEFLVDGVQDPFVPEPLHYSPTKDSAKLDGKESIDQHLVFASQLVEHPEIQKKYADGRDPKDVAASFETKIGSIRAVGWFEGSDKTWEWKTPAPKGAPPTQPAGALEVELRLKGKKGNLTIAGTKLSLPFDETNNATRELEIIIENGPLTEPIYSGRRDYEFARHRLVFDPEVVKFPLPDRRFEMPPHVMRIGGPDCIPHAFAF